MESFARIIAFSLLAAALGACLGFALFGRNSDGTGIALVLGCVGAIVGAIGGSGREIAVALRQKPWS